MATLISKNEQTTTAKVNFLGEECHVIAYNAHYEAVVDALETYKAEEDYQTIHYLYYGKVYTCNGSHNANGVHHCGSEPNSDSFVELYLAELRGEIKPRKIGLSFYYLVNPTPKIQTEFAIVAFEKTQNFAHCINYLCELDKRIKSDI